MWADYIYLDTDERRRFAQVSHEYLIEQVQVSSGKTALTHDLHFNHPVKELIWLSNEHMISTKAKVVLNGHERFAPQFPEYFQHRQPYDYHTRCPSRRDSPPNYQTLKGHGTAPTTAPATRLHFKGLAFNNFVQDTLNDLIATPHSFCLLNSDGTDNASSFDAGTIAIGITNAPISEDDVVKLEFSSTMSAGGTKHVPKATFYGVVSSYPSFGSQGIINFKNMLYPSTDTGFVSWDKGKRDTVGIGTTLANIHTTSPALQDPIIPTLTSDHELLITVLGKDQSTLSAGGDWCRFGICE